MQQEANINDVLEAHNAQGLRKMEKYAQGRQDAAMKAQKKVENHKADELSVSRHAKGKKRAEEEAYKTSQTKGMDRIQQVKERLEREAQERIALQTVALLAEKAEDGGVGGQDSQIITSLIWVSQGFASTNVQ